MLLKRDWTHHAASQRFVVCSFPVYFTPYSDFLGPSPVRALRMPLVFVVTIPTDRVVTNASMSCSLSNIRVRLHTRPRPPCLSASCVLPAGQIDSFVVNEGAPYHNIATTTSLNITNGASTGKILSIVIWGIRQVSFATHCGIF